MKLTEFFVVCFVFLCFFGPDCAQCSIAFLQCIILNLLTNTSIALIYSVTICEKKQRIAHGQGAPDITCSTVVFIFDVCWLS